VFFVLDLIQRFAEVLLQLLESTNHFLFVSCYFLLEASRHMHVVQPAADPFLHVFSLQVSSKNISLPYHSADSLNF
jgi:hypothetical protein